MPSCKITVLKKTFNQDLIDEYLQEECKPRGPCECFEEGQEFIINPSQVPKEFHNRCPWGNGKLLWELGRRSDHW